MSSKIKFLALFAAISLFACSAGGCKKDVGKQESSAPTVSDNSTSDQSADNLPENQKVSTKFEDTKLGKYKYELKKYMNLCKINNDINLKE